MPRRCIEGDQQSDGVRNFDYRSRDDFTVHYEEREVQLSHLTALDFYVAYWMEGWVGHTFLSFVFDNAPPVSISIETRPEVGEGFAPIASLFKQFELIYVVGEERDIVGLRTNHRDELVYLYRLNTSADDARRLFMIYLTRINELADQPEFYHLLSNSCTINVIRYANAAGRAGRFDIRHLLNGLIDSYLYHSGRIDTTLPFDELRAAPLSTRQREPPMVRRISGSAFAPSCRRSRANNRCARAWRRPKCPARRFGPREQLRISGQTRTMPLIENPHFTSLGARTYCSGSGRSNCGLKNRLPSAAKMRKPITAE